jgi:hypothetical protein
MKRYEVRHTGAAGTAAQYFHTRAEALAYGQRHAPAEIREETRDDATQHWADTDKPVIRVAKQAQREHPTE